MVNAFVSLVLMVATLTSSGARADVLLEPFAGYLIGQAKQSGQATVDYKVTTYGARLGYVAHGFMTGLEYMMGEGNEDETHGKLKPTTIGGFIGYTFPILLRVYGTYGFDAKFDRRVGDVTSSYTEGTTVKVGIGITSLSFVALNVEYMSGNFGKLNNQPAAHRYLTGAYGLSLSFPLAF